MTDLEIIAAIRKGKREKPIQQLYKEFPKIRVLIVSSGCKEVLAKEIFNDSLVLLIEKVSNPDFQLTSKLSTYLYGINRFLLQNILRKVEQYLKTQTKLVEEQLRIKAKQDALAAEMKLIREKKLREDAFIQRLKDIAGSCGFDKPENCNPVL